MNLVFLEGREHEGGDALDMVSFTVYCFHKRETPIDE